MSDGDLPAGSPHDTDTTALATGDESRAYDTLLRERDEETARRSTAAVLAARRRTARLWRTWGVVLVVFLLVVLGFIVKVWSTSEIRHVHDRTATVSPSPLANAAPAGSLRAAWSDGDRTALGQPLYYDVLVTYSAHTVTGRDAATGAVRWSYERSDRRICTVAVGLGVAVAIYAHDGNCDEVTGLDAATGSRKWTRTFFESGTDLDVSVRQNYVLVRTPQSLHLFDSGGGLDYWYSPNVSDTPCAVGPAVLGETAGSIQVLVAQDCAGKRTLSLDTVDHDKDGRPTPAWSVTQNGRTPLSADTVVSVLSADGRSVQVLGEKGAVTDTVRLSGTVRPPDAPVATPVQNDAIEIVRVEGSLIALTQSGSAPLWTRASVGLPTESGQQVLTATDGAVLALSPVSGGIERRIAAAPADPSDRVIGVGSGPAVGGSTTAVLAGG